MKCAWQGTLAEASRAISGNHWLSDLEHGYTRAFGHAPTPAESEAWRLSLPRTLTHLSRRDYVPPGTHIVVEYQLPFNGQRVDLALLGRCGGHESAHVVELKCWERSEQHPYLEHCVLVNGMPTPHPSYQAANYAGKLRFFHSEAQAWNVSASAVVLNHDAARHSALKDGRYAELWQAAPVFLPGELDPFGAYVARRLREQAPDEQSQRFLSGTYSQSLRLLQALYEHRHEVLQHAMAALAVSGWGLSDEQLLAFDAIRAAGKAGQPGAYLVAGRPGSGKTLLALHLLLDLVGEGKRVVLAVRNNRLIATLRAILDQSILGARGAVKFFSTRYGQGVEDRDTREADVLICDEAQRLALKTDNVLLRAPVTVVIYDESQVLNMEEHGTADRLRQAASRVNLPIHEYRLPTPHRCRGGARWVEWVDQVLEDPRALRDVPRDWVGEYVADIVPSARALRERLRVVHVDGRRVALVAAFTRSDGRKGGLGKVRIPAPAEVDQSIEWLMDEESEYVPFWRDGRSSLLSQCASIYGCQGFETDHAGVIWGDDLVIRDGHWALGNPNNCYDKTQQVKPLASRMRDEPEAAMILLKNRYRIFLTRGIFGTTIYAEDPETRDFFSSHLPAA